MCLATVYRNDDESIIFSNTARIDVDGETIHLTDIMGDERNLKGRILAVDLAASTVCIQCD